MQINNEPFILRFGRLRVSESDGAPSSGVIELSNGTKTNYVFTEVSSGHLHLRTDSTAHHLILQTPGGNVGIGTMAPGKALHVQGRYSAPLMNDGQDRPGIAITGHYPQLDLFSGVNNSNHGPTIRLGAYNDDSKTSFKHWVIGTAGRNAAFLDIGYSDGNNPNPHAGIRAYNGRTVLTLLKNGNVGIGTTTPEAKLDVRGAIWAGTSDLYFTDPNHDHTGIGNTAGYAAIENAKNYDALMILGRTISTNPLKRVVKLWDYLEVNGSLDVTGNLSARGFQQPSDARHKDDIENLSGALDKVLRLRGVSFRWKDESSKSEKGKQFGLIAQEVNEVLPETVFQDERGLFSIAYNSIISVLVEAIKEQQAHINKIEERISALP
jgi:hypothetical protein